MGQGDTGNVELAEVLKRYRLATGLSQNALALATGLDASTIWKIEAGMRGIGLGTLGRLTKRLGATFKEEAEKAMVRHG